MRPLIVKNYSWGSAELWVDHKHVGTIGDDRISNDKYGSAYERELATFILLGKALGFEVKCLNYEENEKYDDEVEELQTVTKEK